MNTPAQRALPATSPRPARRGAPSAVLPTERRNSLTSWHRATAHPLHPCCCPHTRAAVWYRQRTAFPCVPVERWRFPQFKLHGECFSARLGSFFGIPGAKPANAFCDLGTVYCCSLHGISAAHPSKTQFRVPFDEHLSPRQHPKVPGSARGKPASPRLV